MTVPRIAIIGAGPAGLTLARVLINNSITPDVFESDTSADYRPQGGTLDLHEDSGQQAICDAGLWDEFLKYARCDGQEAKFLVKSGKVIIHVEPKPEGDGDARPEIDRTALRNLLLHSVSPDAIRWGHALKSVEPAGDLYDLHFKDGKVEPGYDLVVGADGAWSRVRPLLTAVKPFYSGCTFISFDITHPEGPEYDGINALIGQGSAYTCSDYKSIFGQRHSDKSIRAYAAFNTNDNPHWADRYKDKSPDEIRADVLTHFKGWPPAALDLVRLADGEVVSRPLYMLPVGFKWETRPGVTLLGDAAHVMTPFAGVGVNMAMGDSLGLARAIIAGVKEGDLNGKIRESEVAMFSRVEVAARRTEKNMKAVMFSDDVEAAMTSPEFRY